VSNRTSARWRSSVLWCVILVAVASGWPAPACSEPMRLPLHEPFTGSQLDKAWTVDVSGTNTVKLSDGKLAISAREHTFGHVERPLGVDLVSASCLVRPGSGTMAPMFYMYWAPYVLSWLDSLFVYWEPANWCQVAVLRLDKMLYVGEMIDGVPHERWIPLEESGEWYRIGIELAEDCVRYSAVPEGKPARTELLGYRHPSWKGRAPTLLALGRGHSRGHSGGRFRAPDLDNDHANPARSTTAMFRDLVVAATPPGRVRMTVAEREAMDRCGRDRLGENELARGAEPTFESVARHFPPMRLPREVVGVKDGPEEIGILPDGAVQFGPRVQFFEAGGPAARFGSGEKGCGKQLLEGHLPVVLADWEHQGTRHRQTVFGWSPELSPDTALAAHVRLNISNPAGEGRKLPLRWKTEASKDPKDPRPVLVWDVDLPSRGSHTVCLCIPFAQPDKAAQVDPGEFNARLNEVAQYWRRLLGKGMKIRVPEQRVNDAYRAWLAYNFLNVDKVNGRYEPHDGGNGFYEQVFAYSAVTYCHALDLMGYHDEARTYLESLQGLISSDGLFTCNSGLMDTGAMLLVMAEHYRLTGDAAWLRRTAPNMLKMCDWIARRRRQEMARQPSGAPHRGLIHFRAFCDHEAPAYSYCTDWFLVAGMEDAADALDAAGIGEATACIRQQSAAYRRDVLRSMDRAVFEHDGMKILPVFPETHELLKSVGYSARDYYGLLASTMLESGFLPAGDKYVRTIREFLERRGGLVLGLCVFNDGIDHAYTYGYWMKCLERDEVTRVLLGFYGSLAYGMSRDTYAAVEVTYLRKGHNMHMLPHLLSNTQQLRLLRNMLVREQGNELLLGQAIARAWLEHGKQVRVEDCPTYFGSLGFVIDSRIADKRITATIDPPQRKPAAVVRLRLRHPRDEPIKSATINGAATDDFTFDTILLKNPQGRTTVEAGY